MKPALHSGTAIAIHNNHMRALAFFLFTLLFSTAALAEAYPLIPIASDDVRVVASPKLDFELRIKLIEQARASIDIVNYDQRTDETIALPLLSALRDAANRGVKVRYIVSALSQIFYDYHNNAARYLIDPPTRRPIEYLIFGGPKAEEYGWNIFDGVHDKLFIVDNRLALTTGRGYAEGYLHWLDTSFAYKGGLAYQTVQAFNDLWHILRTMKAPYAGTLMTHQNPRATAQHYAATPATKLDPAEGKLLEDLLRWYEQPGRDAAAKGRVLHYDFIHQLRQKAVNPSEWGTRERLERLEDPVLNSLVEKMATATDIRLDILVLILHPRLKAALLAAHQRPGVSIRILTNTAAPDLHDWSRKHLEPGGPLWSMELPDLDDLLQAGIAVHQFQINKDLPWVYAHRKLAILDDTVIFGSHNFNVPSTVANDEVSLEIENKELAAELRTLFDADFATNAELLDREFVHRERAKAGHSIMRFFTLPFLGVM